MNEKHFKNLIKHLEERVRVINEELVNLAVEAMEESSGLPFSTLSLKSKQDEYKLAKKELDGFINAVEEVKAFSEGWYDDKTLEGGEKDG